MPRRDKSALCLLSAELMGAEVVDETELAVIDTGVAGAELLDWCCRGPPGRFELGPRLAPAVG